MLSLILIDYNEAWTKNYEWLISIDEGGEKNELLITNDELRVKNERLKIWCCAIQDLILTEFDARGNY